VPLSDLPWYGDEKLGSLPDGATVYVAEGEKATSALRWAGCTAAGTVTGAATIPGDATLSRVARLRPCLWADKDEPGRGHMARIAARLSALGCSRLDLLRWEDAPPHGDAADFMTELRRRGLTREEMAAAVAALPRVPFTAVEDGQR
jgi:DNA primase